ncbi:MAG: YicC/YloC family endoribonuclease [Acidobacteriota bacterium]
MTGFGQAERSLEDVDIGIEIKTVNGRYLDVVTRLPKELSALEPDLRKAVQSRLSRGRAEVYINVTFKSSSQSELNEALVENYLSLAERIRARGVGGELNVAALLNLPGVIGPRQLDWTSRKVPETILEMTQEALDEVVATRIAEGAALKADLQDRLLLLDKYLSQIQGQASAMISHVREKLNQRLAEMGQDARVDQTRLAQEVVFYSDRASITEEITRLKSHIERFSQYLAESDQKRIGKNLDFLCQEMNREMNTILSKAVLPEISDIAVEGKAEIEKMREQVQNVE